MGAWLLWGLFPLYWPLLEPASPVEILGHRIVWSLAFLVGLLALTSGFAWVRRLRPGTTALLTLAAVLVSTNWAVYIYGVNSGHVVETSLGYFINPLVTVLLAIVFLGERLRRVARDCRAMQILCVTDGSTSGRAALRVSAAHPSGAFV